MENVCRLNEWPAPTMDSKQKTQRTNEARHEAIHDIGFSSVWSLSAALPLSCLALFLRNSKFSDGLAQSRLRFLGDLENLFGMTGPLEETLDKLEEVREHAHPQSERGIYKQGCGYEYFCVSGERASVEWEFRCGSLRVFTNNV